MLALPPALAGLADYRQFLLYRVFPGVPPKRARKVPIHPTGLYKVSAHDPKAWIDAQTACNLAAVMGPDYGVAFSVQEGNGLFFVDIDECLSPEGVWSPTAVELCQRFPGAAVEVSTSGRSLHIIGRGTAPPHDCKSKSPTLLGFDLYTKARFIALTGTGITGDVNIDHTAALHRLVEEHLQPTRGDALPESDWGEGPASEWRGPTDDADLLRRAMQSQGAGSIFGNKASFADIWNLNEDKLRVAYPNDDDSESDRSRVDAALAQHLAFWTGKDCDRIERLMRQSPLMRDKWDRQANYLRNTITRAVGLQRDVLTDRPVEPLASLPPDRAAPVNSITRVTGETFLGTQAQMELFAGCVYVYEAKAALVPGGYLLKPEQFKVKYGGYTFTMDDLNNKTTRDAWEAFTQSQSFRVPHADRTCFRPDLAPAEIVPEGSRNSVNVWWPSGVQRVKGDPTLFLQHLAKLLPNERDQRILLSYIAACVQHVGVKFQWCPLIQGVEGNGKSLISRCTAEAVGQRYTHWARADKISAQFNSWLVNNVLACVEDIYVPESKRHVWEVLKPMITGERQEVERKGIDQDTSNVVINFLLNSNHKDAVRKTANDRRLAIFYTAQQTAKDVERDMGGDYMSRIYGWLKHEGGYAVVADFLATYPIDPEFNPAGAAHRAPYTGSTDEAIGASMGSVEHEVLEAIDAGLPGFRGGWISSYYFDKLLQDTRNDMRIPRAARRALLESLGYVPHPGLRDGRVNNTVLPDASKSRLYIKRDHLAYDMQTPADIARAYSQAQN